MRICPKCGGQCSDNNNFCSGCSNSLEYAQYEYNQGKDIDSTNSYIAKKPPYMKWWFWLLVVIGIIGVIYLANSDFAKYITDNNIFQEDIQSIAPTPKESIILNENINKEYDVKTGENNTHQENEDIQSPEGEGVFGEILDGKFQIDGLVLYNNTITGAITNLTEEEYSIITIQFSLYDSNGEKVGLEVASTTEFKSYDSWAFSLTSNVPNALTVKVESISTD